MELTIVYTKWLTSWLSYYVHFFSCKQFDRKKEVEQCDLANDDCMLPKRKYLKYQISKTLMHGFFQKLDECIPQKQVICTWKSLIVNKELLSMIFCARKINIQEYLYIFSQQEEQGANIRRILT